MATLLLVLIVDCSENEQRGEQRRLCSRARAVDGSENEQRGEQRRLCSRARAGGGAGGQPPSPPPVPLFEKKKGKEKKYIFSNKRNL